MRRSYHQHCAVAKALDVVGDRWTLLLIRELLLGPRRYTDLLAGLPGIGTNLLAHRLRDLEAAQVVARRALPAPAGSVVYELTPLGRGLEPILLQLGRWGAAFLGEPRPQDARRAGWYVVSMAATFRPELAHGLDRTFELQIDEDVFHLSVCREQVAIGSPRSRPALVVRTDLDTFLGLLSSDVEPKAALEAGDIELEGSREDFVDFIELFRWPVLEHA